MVVSSDTKSLVVAGHSSRDHLYTNFHSLEMFGIACPTLHSPLPTRVGLEQNGGDRRAPKLD